jgi:hypothetical protein
LRQNVVAPVSLATLVMSPAVPVGPMPVDCRCSRLSSVTVCTAGLVRRRATAGAGMSATSVPSEFWVATTVPPSEVAAEPAAARWP